MRGHVVFGMALAMASGCVAAAAEPDGIEHTPLTCALADSFVRVEARWPGAAPPVAARVDFRVAGDDAWYGVAMRQEGASLVALLPRPGVGLAAFEYRLSASDAAGHSSQTVPHSVRVSTEAACPSGRVIDSGGAVVVEVPKGRPTVPPVPRGFNPAGAVGAAEAAGNKPRHLGRIAGGAAVAAGLGGLAVVFGGHAGEPSGGSDNTTPGEALRVQLVSADPPPGSTLVLGRDSLSVTLQVGSPRLANGVDYLIDLDFLDPATDNPCVRLSSQFTFRPVVAVNVARTVQAMGGCGEAFDTSALRVFVRRLTFETVILTGTAELPDLVVPYRFVP